MDDAALIERMLAGDERAFVEIVRRYDDVAAVLGGDRSRVRTLPMTPGTLLVFEGRNSLHRVSPAAALGAWVRTHHF